MNKYFIIIIIFTLLLINCSKEKEEEAVNRAVKEESVNSTEQSEYSVQPDSENTGWFVMPPDGITLREGPDSYTNDLAVIPHGAQVNILEYTGEMITVFERPGKWAKIQYNDLEGYCFSAFLGDNPDEELFIFPEHKELNIYLFPGFYLKIFGFEQWPLEVPETEDPVLFIDDFFNDHTLIIANVKEIPQKMLLSVETPDKKTFSNEYSGDDIREYDGAESGEVFSPTLKLVDLYFNASMKPGTYVFTAELTGSEVLSISGEYKYGAYGPDILETVHDNPLIKWDNYKNFTKGSKLWLFGTSPYQQVEIIVAFYRRYDESDFDPDIFSDIDRLNYYSYMLPQGAVTVKTDSLGQYAVPFIPGKDLLSSTYHSGIAYNNPADIDVYGFWGSFHID